MGSTHVIVFKSAFDYTSPSTVLSSFLFLGLDLQQAVKSSVSPCVLRGASRGLVLAESALVTEDFAVLC